MPCCPGFHFVQSGLLVVNAPLFVLFPALFFPCFRSCYSPFGARGFFFTISIAFSVIRAFRRPVNRLYFLTGSRRVDWGLPLGRHVAAKSTGLTATSHRLGSFGAAAKMIEWNVDDLA